MPLVLLRPFCQDHLTQGFDSATSPWSTHPLLSFLLATFLRALAGTPSALTFLFLDPDSTQRSALIPCYLFFRFCIPCSCLRLEFLHPPSTPYKDACLTPRDSRTFHLLINICGQERTRTSNGWGTCVTFGRVFVDQPKRKKGKLLPQNKVGIDGFLLIFYFWSHFIKVMRTKTIP